MSSLLSRLPEFNSPEEILEAAYQERARRQRKKLEYFFPSEGPFRRELYPKHMQFFAAGGSHEPIPGCCPPECDGSPHRERCFVAANRIGKTSAGVYETTLHLTGKYPAWWTGRRFNGHIKAWAASDTSKTVRSVLQEKFLGPPNARGTGLIPADDIVYSTTKAGIAEATDTIYVKHVSGGVSSVQLKSYQEGRESFQADTIDFVLLDEEPTLAIYAEALVRTMSTDGQIALVFTPLQGLSEVVLSFMPEGAQPKVATE